MGTNFFTVVDRVGLQVVAYVGHYEKGGDGAQVLAPAVLLLEIPERQTVGTNEQKSTAPAIRVQVKEGGGEVARADFVHPGTHPAFSKAN